STVIYTLSLHDALPIFQREAFSTCCCKIVASALPLRVWRAAPDRRFAQLSKLASPLPSLDSCAAGTLSVSFILPPCNLTLVSLRSEEHTSELQSQSNLV